jgi:tRNA modification GTPase
VTAIPGTTRDAIEADIAVDGFPFRLVDTAGVREDAEPIERLGIEVARGYVERADVLLLCRETGAEWAEGMSGLAREAEAAGARVLRVWTKGDLARGPCDAGPGELVVSVRTGLGMSALREALVGAVFAGLRDRDTPPLVTRRRQRRSVERARDQVASFERSIGDGLPTEIAATHLEEAVLSLEELVGVTDLEDVLDVIFGSFCVGK